MFRADSRKDAANDDAPMKRETGGRAPHDHRLTNFSGFSAVDVHALW